MMIGMMLAAAVSAGSVVESAREIPVAGEYDVAVVGGTSAGVAAAVAAQEAGAKVFLVGGYPYLGEDLASTLELGDGVEPPRTELARRLWTSATDKAPYTFTFDRRFAVGYSNDADSRVAITGFPQTSTEVTAFNGDVTYSCRLDDPTDVARVEVVVTESPDEWLDAAKRPKKGRDSILAKVKDITLTVKEGDAKGRSFPMRRVASVPSGSIHWRQKANLVTFAAEVGGRVAAADVKFRLADGASEVCVSRIWFRRGAVERRLRRPTPLQVKQALDRELVTRRIPFLTASPATDLLCDGDGRVSGVVIANRSGRQAVKAKCVIDATRYATLSRLGRGVEGLKGPTRFTRTIITNGTDLVRVPLVFDLPDGSYRSFARAEWEARERTWSHLTLDDADEMVLVDKLSSPVEKAGLITVDGQLALDERIDAGTAAGRKAASLAKGRGALKGVAVERAVAGGGDSTAKGDVRELLGGLRAYRGKARDFVRSPERELPVLATCDVVVAGGGTSGASAAVGAAKAGARTIVCEWIHVLGGIGTDGMIVSYCAGNNRGFSRRFQSVERRRGAVHVHPETREAEEPDPDPTKRAATSYYQRSESWRELCNRYGVEVWFGTMAEGAYVADGKVAGLVVVTPFGRGVILANATIDATGNADIAAAAGAETAFISRDELMLQSAGQGPHRLGKGLINTDFGFVNDADACDLWLFGLRARAGALDSWDLQKLPDSRERRHIVPDGVLSGEDVVSYRKFPDTLVQPYAPQDAHGALLEDFCYLSAQSDNVVWNRAYSYFRLNVPLRSLLPKGLGGIAVVGTGAGCSRDVMPMVRMQSDLMNMGFAAGLAAAMAPDGDFRKVDLAALRKRLVDEDVLEPAAVGWTDEPDLTSDAVVAAAVKSMADGFRGSDIVFRRENRARALPLLRAAWTTAQDDDTRFPYALMLGFLGDATGAETLVKAVRGELDLEKLRPVRRFGDRVSPMDGCLIALGRTRSPKALEPLLKQISQMDEETTFAKMRGAMLALKALGDPRAAKPLAELLRKPGIGGHAVREAFDLGPTGGYGPDFEMHRCLRELAIARALLASDDCEGLGRRTFESYRDDPRGTLSEYASRVLAGM